MGFIMAAEIQASSVAGNFRLSRTVLSKSGECPHDDTPARQDGHRNQGWRLLLGRSVDPASGTLYDHQRHSPVSTNKCRLRPLRFLAPS
jgi:hypothetical protein